MKLLNFSILFWQQGCSQSNRNRSRNQTSCRRSWRWEIYNKHVFLQFHTHIYKSLLCHGPDSGPVHSCAALGCHLNGCRVSDQAHWKPWTWCARHGCAFTVHAAAAEAMLMSLHLSILSHHSSKALRHCTKTDELSGRKGPLSVNTQLPSRQKFCLRSGHN